MHFPEQKKLIKLMREGLNLDEITHLIYMHSLIKNLKDNYNYLLFEV